MLHYVIASKYLKLHACLQELKKGSHQRHSMIRWDFWVGTFPKKTQKQGKKDSYTNIASKWVLCKRKSSVVYVALFPYAHSWVPQDVLYTRHGLSFRWRWLARFILGCDRSNAFDNFGHFTPPSLGSFACHLWTASCAGTLKKRHSWYGCVKNRLDPKNRLVSY